MSSINIQDESEKSDSVAAGLKISNGLHHSCPEEQVSYNVNERCIERSEYRRQSDVFYYVVGCIISFGTVFLLGFSPTKYFFYWMTTVQVLIIGKRYIEYQKLHWHYYLVDFCYFCNTTLSILIHIYPSSEVFYYGCYVSGTGCLANALYVFRNSLAFHDMDKICGSVIHFFPQLTMWHIHWNIRGTAGRSDWGFMQVEDIQFDWSFMYTYLSSFYLFYLVWAPLYYFLVIVVFMPIIKKNNGSCLILFEFETGPIMKKVYKKYGTNIGYLAFALQHFIYVTLFAFQTLPGFFLKPYSTIQMMFYAFCMFKNGSTFYIDWFATKYEAVLKDLDEAEEKVSELTQ